MYPVLSETTGHRGIYDFKEGCWAIAPRFDWISSLRNGYAFATLQDGTECFVDRNGKIITLAEIVRPACDKVAVADYSYKYPDDTPMTRNCGCVVLHDAEYQYIVILDAQLHSTLIDRMPRQEEVPVYFDNGWVVCRTSNSVGYRFKLIKDDKKIEIADVSHVYASQSGPFVICDFVDRSVFYCPEKEKIVSDSYHFAGTFSDGVALIQQHDSCSSLYFVNRAMERIPELEFEWAKSFSFGLAPAVRDDVSGYYGLDGKCHIRVAGNLYCNRFNRFGHAILAGGPMEDELCLIDRKGHVVLDEMRTYDFFDGDFPCYDVTFDEPPTSFIEKDYIVTPAMKVYPAQIAE